MFAPFVRPVIPVCILWRLLLVLVWHSKSKISLSQPSLYQVAVRSFWRSIRDLANCKNQKEMENVLNPWHCADRLIISGTRLWFPQRWRFMDGNKGQIGHYLWVNMRSCKSKTYKASYQHNCSSAQGQRYRNTKIQQGSPGKDPATITFSQFFPLCVTIEVGPVEWVNGKGTSWTGKPPEDGVQTPS